MQLADQCRHRGAPPFFPGAVSRRYSGAVGMIDVIEIAPGAVVFHQLILSFADPAIGQVLVLQVLHRQSHRIVGIDVLAPAYEVKMHAINIIIGHDLHRHTLQIFPHRRQAGRQPGNFIGHLDAVLVAADPLRMELGGGAGIAETAFKSIEPGMEFQSPGMGLLNGIGQGIETGILKIDLGSPGLDR